MTHPTYPDEWPKPNPFKPLALASRITETQKEDLYQRRVSTRDLAQALNVHEKYLSDQFPGKIPTPKKRELINARKAYRMSLARGVLEGRYTVKRAAEIAYVSYNTMQRIFKKAKLEHPELAAKWLKRHERPQ